MFGPQLPSHLIKKRQMAGPTQPVTDVEDGSDDDDFGPALPPASSAEVDQLELDNIRKEIDSRASNKTIPQAAPATVARPDWMTQLPDLFDLSKAQNSNKTSRTFLRKGVDIVTDRSDWTDTPANKAERPNTKRQKIISAPEPTPIAPTRGPSLMETHNHHKQKAEPILDNARTPFDRHTLILIIFRDRDIGVSAKVDFKRRRDMLHEAKQLDSKFAKGS